MSKRTCGIVTLFVLVCVLSVMPLEVLAQFGKPKTKTASANMQTSLGEYKGLKHAIGCKDFENQAGWRGNWELGNNLAIMLESSLYDTGRFILVERDKLKDVIAEQDLAASGRTAKAKQVAQTGLIRSARYIATGAVTQVDENQAGADGGVSFRGIRVGGGRSQSQITVIVKLIDTTTGEIVAKESIVGKAGKVGLKVGLSRGGFSGDIGGFAKTPLGEAAQDCINQAAEFIAKQMEEFPFEGSVVRVGNNGQVIINRGSEFGVEVGQDLVMAEEGELLIDPDTGAVLDKEEGEVIGKLKVAKVSEKVAYCDVISGDKNPATGTVIRAE